MTILRDLSLIWSLLHVTILFLMLFRSQYTARKTILIGGIGLTILSVVNLAGLWFLGINVMGRMMLFTCSIPSLIFFYLLSEDKSFSFLFTFCLVDTACLWILAATNLLDYFFGQGQYLLMFVLRLMAFPALEYITYRYLRDFYLTLMKIVQEGWGAYAGLTMLYYALLLVVLNYPSNIMEHPENMLTCILLLILMIFNYVVIFHSLYRQYLLYEQQKTERILQEQKLSLEAQLENQQHIRKLKHDMRGHTITILGLLNAGKEAEAVEYLKKMEDHIEGSQKQICANPYMNAVFGYYLQKFREIDAPLQLNIQIGNREVPYMEVCRILSNGLENAYEASVALKPEEREISVQMKFSKDYLIIRIRNRCASDFVVEKGKLPTTKKKSKGHGIGLLSMKEAAEMLDGDMICYTENNNFVLDVMIRMT